MKLLPASHPFLPTLTSFLFYLAVCLDALSPAIHVDAHLLADLEAAGCASTFLWAPWR